MSDTKSTLQLDFENFTIKRGTKTKRFQIWDTAGQDKFRVITQSYLRKADGAIVVFDVTDKRSYDQVKKWLECLRNSAPLNIPLVLFGNKIDLEDDRVIECK